MHLAKKVLEYFIKSSKSTEAKWYYPKLLPWGHPGKTICRSRRDKRAAA